MTNVERRLRCMISSRALLSRLEDATSGSGEGPTRDGGARREGGPLEERESRWGRAVREGPLRRLRNSSPHVTARRVERDARLDSAPLSGPRRSPGPLPHGALETKAMRGVGPSLTAL